MTEVDYMALMAKVSAELAEAVDKLAQLAVTIAESMAIVPDDPCARCEVCNYIKSMDEPCSFRWSCDDFKAWEAEQGDSDED